MSVHMIRIARVLSVSIVSAYSMVMFASPVSAATITITNSSFELPDAPDVSIPSDGFASGAPTGWVHNGTGTIGVIGEARTAVPDTPFADQWGFLAENGNQLGQAIGTGLEFLGGTIDVSYIGARRMNEGTNMNHNVLIMAGTGATFVGGVVLDTQNYNTNLPNNAESTYATINLSLDALGSVGGNTQLWLVFDNQVSGGGSQLVVDNVAASATLPTGPAPEPNTLVLALLSVCGMVLGRRRRNRG